MDIYIYYDSKILEVSENSKILKHEKYLKTLTNTWKNMQIPKKNPKVYHKSYLRNLIPKIYFLKFKILPETRNYNRKPESKTWKVFIIPKTHSKYWKHIWNTQIYLIHKHKTFHVLWIPDRVSGRIRNRTYVGRRKNNQICTFPWTQTKMKTIFWDWF